MVFHTVLEMPNIGYAVKHLCNGHFLQNAHKKHS